MKILDIWGSLNLKRARHTFPSPDSTACPFRFLLMMSVMLSFGPSIIMAMDGMGGGGGGGPPALAGPADMLPGKGGGGGGAFGAVKS